MESTFSTLRCVLLKPTKEQVGKDTVNTKPSDSMTDNLLVDLTPSSQEKDAEKSSTAAADEYRARLAEKRRIAREKAEMEAAQEEERRRQQQ